MREVVKIIHTLEFTINNFTEDIYSLSEIHKRFKPLGQQKEKDKQFKLYTYGTGAITYTYYDYFVVKDTRLTHIGNRNEIYSKKQDTMKIVVNVSKLLEKDVITPVDYDLFKKVFTASFTGLFPSHKYIDIENHEQIKLTRIDYKKDFYTEYKNLYIELLAKTSKKGHLKANSNSSTYYSSNSYNINLYDKLEERQAKNQSTDNIDNLLRFEIQLLKDRIEYNFKHDGVIPTLKNYWSMADYNYYFNYCLHDIIYKGNYFNLYHAKIKINNSKKSKTVKKNLIEFITYISINGIGEAKKQFKSSFKNYITYLNDIEVNPVLIAKNKSIQYKVTSLDNIFNFYYENEANTYLLDNYNVIKENYIHIAV